MLLSLLKHHLDHYITDTALKVLRSLYCFTTSISHHVQLFPQVTGVWASLMLCFSNCRNVHTNSCVFFSLLSCLIHVYFKLINVSNSCVFFSLLTCLIPVYFSACCHVEFLCIFQLVVVSNSCVFC